ncbi:MAG: TRAP transporter substrate-binding protein DctP [Pseudolabrys sp.]
MRRREFITILGGAITACPLRTALAADYKPEFKMSIVGPNEDTPWGRAATRFAGAIKYRTQGRIQIKNYFNGQLFAGKQTTEFAHLQQGLADFSIGSTINWSPQLKQLNIFALPFMFPGYAALDAVEGGEPGERLFKLIERNGAIPIAWGENGFRELTNSKRPIRRPEDLDGLKIRVVGVPLFVDTFEALGAIPIPMNFDKALEAFRQGTVDGQENPVALIIPHKLWAAHKYVTLWHYAIDPLILAVSGKTWGGLSHEDQRILQEVGQEVMGQQKKEAREGLEESTIIIEKLQDLYGMEVFYPSAADIESFRNKTRSVYAKWSEEIGIELVRSVEGVVAKAK